MALIGTPVQATADRIIIMPNGFPWPVGTYPITVFGAEGRFSTAVNPRSLVNSGIWTSTTFIHVNSSTGVDASAAVVSSPTDTSKAAKTIGKAIQLGNAAATPYRIFVKADTVVRANGLNGINPTQPCSIEAWGGRVVMGPFDVLTWAADVTYTNTYSATRSGVARVFDLTATLDKWGKYQELTLVADAATCNTTPGSWAQVGSTLYVRRTDGAAATNSNVRAYLGGSGVHNINLGTGVLDFYLSGFDLEGGNAGCLISPAAATHNIVAEDCTFRYAGSLASLTDCVQLTSLKGIAAFFRCDASAGAKDGFNVHWTTGGAPAGDNTYLLTVDCTGRDNGRGTSVSNNGWTTHERVIGIDVNGDYAENYGGNVHSIGTSQSWCVGTVSRRSIGDLGNGGTITSTGFRTNDSAVMWLDSTLADGNLLAIDAHDGTAAIYKRGHRSSGGMEYAATGTTLANY